MWKYLIIAYGILVNEFECYKILIYAPKMGHSHVNFLGSIADTLVEAGHDVVVYLPAFDDTVKTNGTKLARTIHRARDFEMLADRSHLVENAWTKRGQDVREVLFMISALVNIQKLLCESQLKDESLIKQLKDENFDIGISEVISSCGFGLFEKIGIKKYLAAFATTLAESVTDPLGIESNPSFVPASFSPNSDEMDYLSRIENFASFLLTEFVVKWIAIPSLYETFRKHIGSDYDPIETMAKRTSFVFVNAEEYLEFPRPINHKVVYVGGIAVPKPKPLNMEYEKLMSEAGNGAVLISFGSIAKSSFMSNETKEAFLNAFRTFPEITFIWKYEEDDSVGSELANVFKKKWVPQNDLLHNPKMRAFVSHGGLNSITESVLSGIPIICIPLFGDQMRNAKMIEKRGVGIILDKMNLTTEAVTSAFKNILYDEKYMKSSKRLSKMIANKPIPVRERIVKYTEFAAKFGGIDNLDPASRKLNFIQYYLLDIIIPFILIVILLCYFIFKTVLFIFKKIIRFQKTKIE